MTRPDNAPPVIVGISTVNRADILRKAIQSAYAQSYRPLRVSVVDDASTDRTPSVRDEFPDISWYRCNSGEGISRTRNRMMLGASEQYFVSLDDDAWFLRGDEIALAIDLLERKPCIAAIAFDILSPDRALRRERGAKQSVSMFIGCGHVLRLAAVKQLGGYSEFPGSYGGEEKDLCLRLIDAGYEVVQLTGVHVWHDKTVTARDVARQHTSGVCNDLTFALRRVPFALLLPVIGYKVVSHIVFSIRHDLIGACMRGIGTFGRVSFNAWRTRQPVRWSTFLRYQSLARAPREVAG